MKKLYVLLLGILILRGVVTYGQTQINNKQLNAVEKGKNDTAQISRLIWLAMYQIHKPGEFKNDLDSAANFISRAMQINNKLKDNTAEGRICLTTASLYNEQKQSALSRAFTEKAINTFTKTAPNYSYLGDAYIQLSDFYSIYDSTYVAKEKTVSTAITFFHLAKNWVSEEYCHEFLGDIFATESDDDNGEKEELRAIEIARLAHKTNIQRVYDILDVVNEDRANYKEALRYGLLALKTAESDHDTSTMLCTIYNRLGIVYGTLKETQNAADCYKKALRVAVRNHDDDAIILVVANLARAMKQLHKSAEGLQVIEQYAKGYSIQKEEFALPLLELNTDLKNYKAGQLYCNEIIDEDKVTTANLGFAKRDYPIMIDFFIQSKQYHKALKYLNLNSKIVPVSEGSDFAVENQRLWFMYDTTRRKYKSAITHLIAFKTLRDSMLNEDKTKQFANLELQYGKEKDAIQLKLKDQDIRLLNQNALIETSKLKSAESLKNAVLGSSVLLLIILLLVFYQYRLKQNNNKIITKKNLSMQKLLKEMEGLLDDKEMLIKEVHHRVKNNLHMISSLLESQSAYLENEALHAVQKSQHRIQAISILHQKLYLNDNITSVAMQVYLREIITYLKDSFIVDGSIVFDVHLEDIYLDVSQAVPIGLIVNEVVTNAIKYAFPNNASGIVKIFLVLHSVDECTLDISDNGVGIQNNYDISKNNSLGMSLIKGLAKTLGAKFTLSTGSGTEIMIAFNPARIYRTGLNSVI